MNLVRASLHVRARIGSLPEYCNYIIKNKYGAESNFLDSQIVNGYLVPSRVKFDSMYSRFRNNGFSDIKDYHQFFNDKLNRDGQKPGELLESHIVFVVEKSLRCSCSLDAERYLQFLQGTPLYMLFLSEYSSRHRQMQKTILRTCKGRGFNVDPDSLYYAIMKWTMSDWPGLEHCNVALVDPKSPGSKREVKLSDLPVNTLKYLFNMWEREREEEKQEKLAGRCWNAKHCRNDRI